MRKFLLIFSILFGMLFSACEVIDQRPDCEKYHYGSVPVINDTKFKVKIDVTWDGVNVNEVRTLRDGESTTYYQVPSGNFYLRYSLYYDIGYSPYWQAWDYEMHQLMDCEETKYKLYSKYSKKSTNPEGIKVISLKENINY